MIGKVESIYIGQNSPASLTGVSSATIEEGRGIVGDRYFYGNGTFSKNKPDRHVTLIEAEEIDRFNSENGFTFGYGEFRRNIVTRGIRLNDLVGKTFQIGGTTLKGLRTCEPCKHLAKLLAPEVFSEMANRAGLRAQVVSGSIIVVGDTVGNDAS